MVIMKLKNMLYFFILICVVGIALANISISTVKTSDISCSNDLCYVNVSSINNSFSPFSITISHTENIYTRDKRGRINGTANINKSIKKLEAEFSKEIRLKLDSIKFGVSRKITTINFLDYTHIIAENFLTKTKTVNASDKYTPKFMNITKLTDKKESHAYMDVLLSNGTVIGTLNLETRIVNLEGFSYESANRWAEMCSKDKNKWSWCSANGSLK
jgi:hypothetical protein